MPHFISWVVVTGIAYAFFSSGYGIFNELLLSLGILKEPVDVLTDPDSFYGLAVASAIWKEAGWWTIIFLAALAGIDPSLYEAAEMDGAGRIKRILYITLPGLKSASIVVLILSIGSMLGGGLVGSNFEQSMLLGNSLNSEKSQIIQTYAFNIGLGAGQILVCGGYRSHAIGHFPVPDLYEQCDCQAAIGNRFILRIRIGGGILVQRRKTLEDRCLDSFIRVVLVFIVFMTLYPFYYILVITFNSGTDTTLGGMYVWPRDFTFGNYIYFLKDPKWLSALGMSLIRTVVGTALGVLFTAMVAYGLARRDLLFRKSYFFIIVFAMNFSGGLIAYYIVLKSLGLINNFGVYVIPGMLNLFFLLIAISFFNEIPEELGESARMDGASGASYLCAHHTSCIHAAYCDNEPVHRFGPLECMAGFRLFRAE